MSFPTDGPCLPWLTASDLELAPGFNPDNKVEPTILADAIDVASYLLFKLSGQQFSGGCEVAVRPTRYNSGYSILGNFGWSSKYPMGLWDLVGEWGLCDCGGECGCANVQQITLGAYPLQSITYVKIDGAILSSSKYRIDDYKYLVRTDGQAWPTSQDLTLDSSQAGTFEVKFVFGRPIPTAGKRAAARLAMEFARAYSGQKCKLPERVASITRQDVTIAFVDTQDFFEKGRTGIYEVDIFLNAVNPKGRRSSATISSPDVGRKTRRTGT